MHSQSILNVWDNCMGKNQTFKGVALASLGVHEMAHAGIMDWSIEKRDIALFHLRKKLFGSQFNNMSQCPQCTQIMEWGFAFDHMKIPSLESVPDNMELPLHAANQNLRVRLPNSNDLLSNDETQIIQNCILDNMAHNDDACDEKKPDLIIGKINDLFNEVCQVSNRIYRLKCAECSHEWNVGFDIVSYLWTEIDHWAKKFLDQIYLLAKTCGWSESEIINMSDHRRNYYLKLMNS